MSENKFSHYHSEGYDIVKRNLARYFDYKEFAISVWISISAIFLGAIILDASFVCLILTIASLIEKWNGLSIALFSIIGCLLGMVMSVPLINEGRALFEIETKEFYYEDRTNK